MRSILALLACAALAGCAPTTARVYVQEGSTGPAREAQLTRCQVDALRQVPRALGMRRSPLGVTPGAVGPLYTQCIPRRDRRDRLRCVSRPGPVFGPYAYGGRVETYDLNAPLRGRVTEQCMADRGYRRGTLPVCSPAEAAAGPAYPARGPMPDPAAILCYDRTRDAFVTLG